MEILKINATKGPNYWSLKRHNLIVMLLDIGDLEYQPTNEIQGFYPRLKKALPGLYEHRCSEGVAGGFFRRVQRGTWMAHVIEHIALELQVMAGLDVSFGRARGTGKRGCYQVVFDYIDEESGRFTARLAVQIAEDLVHGISPGIKTGLKKIKSLSAKHAVGPSTAAILREARRRNIPYFRLNQHSLYQLGYGCKQKRFAATIASSSSQLAVDLACNKVACKQMLQEMALPIAPGEVVYTQKELLAAIEELGYPLVLKPAFGNHGRGVTTNIRNKTAALKALRLAKEVSNTVIVERYVEGFDFRLLVINYQFIAAAQRTPAHVVGDGKHSIHQLIRQLNRDPRRGEGHEKVLTKIRLSKSSRERLKMKGYSLNSILPAGQTLYLNQTANLSTGGTASDFTAATHPEVQRLAERVARVLQLDICGIDLIAPNLSQPLSSSGGVILEVNAAPGFRMHLAPSQGNAINVAAPVLDMLFPYRQNGRIPIVAVSGTNGKTTTTRLIAHILKTAGKQVGYTTTDGVYICDELILKGDCTGPKSSEMVLRDPTVETAVLECARGGLLRSGLAFDRCEVGVITNVASDHLGIQGIDSLEKMARLKAVVAESVAPEGYAILNADDDLVYAMKKKLQSRVALFSMESANERIMAHRENEGICVVLEQGFIIIYDEGKCYRLVEVGQLPLSFKGTARFMVENILAAVAASYVQEVALATIKRALLSFLPSPFHTPGRMNCFQFKNFEVIVDYAHNPAGLMAVKDFLSRSSYLKKVGIVAAIGDRRVEDSLEIGRIAAETFDEVIIREDSDLRGRQPGELIEIVKSGIATASRHPLIKIIRNEIEALQAAIDNAIAGSVIVLCTENVREVLDYIQEKQQSMQSERWKQQAKQLQQAAQKESSKLPSAGPPRTL